MSGETSYYAGLAAEDSVQRYYERRGFDVIKTRWRGKSGEIDLIVRDGTEYVFTEVKKARSHSDALLRLSTRQIGRISRAASEFVGGLATGQLTPMRFDFAVVDAQGEVSVIENAFGGM